MSPRPSSMTVPANIPADIPAIIYFWRETSDAAYPFLSQWWTSPFLDPALPSWVDKAAAEAPGNAEASTPTGKKATAKDGVVDERGAKRKGRKAPRPKSSNGGWPKDDVDPRDMPSGRDVVFRSAEQYMMYRKAHLFGDAAVALQILETTSPRAIKALGRKVRGFDDTAWCAARQAIVERANWCKFMHGRGGEAGEADGVEVGAGATNVDPELPNLKTRLLATGTSELVEASPYDRIWGIGFTAQAAEGRRAEWGANLLGKALMRVRERIQREESEGGGGEA